MQYVITALFIFLDVVSGVVKAIKQKDFNSTKMREGLFHKMAFVIFVALAVLCDYGQQFLEIGFQIPITKSVCVYVVFTEIGSVIENLSIINPELVPSKLRSIFKSKGV